MKASLLLALFLSLVAVSNGFSQGAKLKPDNPAESERDRPQERARWFLRGRMVDGKPGSTQLQRAYNQKLNHRRLRSLATGSVSGPAGGPPWIFLGPAPTATAAFNSNQQNYGPAIGRVTSVAVDQGDPSGNTVYIGGASGGVWKTINAASAPRTCDGNGVCTAPAVWTPLTDNQATLTAGAIALQPGNSNLVLVGTGEANNSADSYYGLGILRSTDAGTSWNLISSAICPVSNPACPATGSVSFHGLGFTRLAFSADNNGTLSTNNVVATAAAAAGGLGVGAESGGTAARGIYVSSDAGATWKRATVQDTDLACIAAGRSSPCTPDAGSANSVVYHSVQKKFFTNLRFHGIYSSSDGLNFSRLDCQPGDTVAGGVCQHDGILNGNACPSATSSGCPLYRAEMAVAPGRDEMYVWIYDASGSDVGMWQTKDGGLHWTRISTAGIDSCGDSLGCGNDATGQGTYNITLAAVPNGGATDLYAGGVNQYKCRLDPVSNPTCTTSPFLNLTHVYGCSPAGNIAHVHPDEHGIDFLGNDATGAFFAAHPSTSPPVFFGNDGGIYRVSQSSSLVSGSCPAAGTTPASGFDNLSVSSGLSMIQLVGFAHAAQDPTTLVGGTQDNGSPAVSATSSGKWLSVNNGDGGFTDINPLNASEWFTSNPAPLTASGGIQRCASGINCTFQTFAAVVTQNQIGGDYSSFYTFYMLDPQASTRMLAASCRVWRGDSDGTGSDWSVGGAGGNPLTLNLNTGVAASCANPNNNPTTLMVNTIAAGGPCNGPCNPSIAPASGSGGGSQAIWAGMEGVADASSAAVQCLPGNGNGTPCGGQVWRTLAADTGPGSWSEVSGLNSGRSAACTSTPSACNINPKHYTISGIALDPHDATGGTAYVTVMGFGVGHVFKTTNTGATWALLDGNPNTTGLPDAPADAVVADPNVAGLVYVGTDVGVFSSTGDGLWTELGPASGAGSLPNVVVTQLKIYNNPNDSIPLRLRASTYGRGIWEIPIGQQPGYTMSIANPTLFAFPGKTAAYNGTITSFFGYNDPINITCTSGATAPPSTCPNSGNPVVVTAPATNGSFSVSAGNSGVGDFTFNLTAVGTDLKTLTQQSTVTFHAVDFSLGAVSGAATVAQGDSADVRFNVTPAGQFTGDITFACSGQPAGSPCNFSPQPVKLTPGAPASVRLVIPTTASTTTGPYSVTITGTSTLAGSSQSHDTPAPLSLTVVSAAQAFEIATSAISKTPVKPGEKPTAAITVSSSGTYSGTLELTCSLPGNGGAGCSLNPASASLSPGQSLPSTLTVDTSGASAANLLATVTARDAAANASKSVSVAYSVIDYALALSAPAAIVPNGGPASVGVTMTALNGYAGSVAATCSVPSPLTCTLNPAGPYLPNSGATPVATVTVAAPTNTPGGNYTLAVNSNDAAFPSLSHNASTNIAVQDFANPRICNATSAAGTCDTTATVKAGASASFNISVAALGGFNSSVTFSCSNLPSLAACSFSTNPVSAGGSTALTISTKAASVAQLRSPKSPHRMPLYAFWLSMPGIVGVVIIGLMPTRKRARFSGMLGAFLIVGMSLILSSCGGGGGGNSTTPPIPQPGTPAGTYTVTVTGTSGSGATSLTHSTTITLIVQ